MSDLTCPIVKPSFAAKRGLYAMMLSVFLSVCLFVCSFVCRLFSLIQLGVRFFFLTHFGVRAVPHSSSLSRENSLPVKFIVAAGACSWRPSTNAPHLFVRCLFCRLYVHNPGTLLADETVRQHLKVDANGNCTTADPVSCIHVS